MTSGSNTPLYEALEALRSATGAFSALKAIGADAHLPGYGHTLAKVEAAITRLETMPSETACRPTQEEINEHGIHVAEVLAKRRANAVPQVPGRSPVASQESDSRPAVAAPSTDKKDDATPRTDGMVREVVDAMVSAGAQWDYVVPAEFARQLERELAEARAAAALHENAASHCAQMVVDALPSAELPRSDAALYQAMLTLQHRCGYIINFCKDVREMRLEAEEMLRVLRSLKLPSASAALRERDLAMMVRRLAARIRLRSRTGPHATPDMALSESAMDFLKRLGLEGSVTRDDEPRLEQSNSPDSGANK